MNPDHSPNHQSEQPLDGNMLDALDQSREPSPELEDRIVALLAERQLIQPRPRAESHELWFGPERSRTIRRGPAIAWLVGAAAAAIAFVAGLRVGERHAQQPAMPAVTAAGTSRVRQAAFEYISALSAVQPTDAVSRDAALGTFRTAADQIVRLAPDSEIGIAIRLALPSSFVQSPAAIAVAGSPKKIIWF